MTGNGRGTMRPAGRSPPFLAIGLFVALVILGFNYWSLSARNGEQANELSLMESELRLVSAKKTSAEKRSEAISDKVTDLEKQLNEQRESYANKAAELSNTEREKETLANRVNEVEKELNKLHDEQLPKCEQEKTVMQEEIKNLKDNVEFHKKRCDELSCDTAVKQSRDKTLEDIYKAAGVNPLISLYKASGDLGSYHDQISKLAAQVDQQPLAGGGNVAENQQQNPQPGAEQPKGDEERAAIEPHGGENEQGAAQNPPPPQGDTGAQNDNNQAPNEQDASKVEDSNLKVEEKDFADEGTEQRDEGEGDFKVEGRADIGEGQGDDKDYGDKIPDDKNYEEDDDKGPVDDTLRVNNDNNEEDNDDYDYEDENAADGDYNYNNDKARDLDKEEDGIDEMFRNDDAH